MYPFASRACFLSTVISKAGLAVLLLVSSLAINAAAADAAENQLTDEQAPQQARMPGVAQRHFNFPRWPASQTTGKEIIPPPPPGPYMSSALSDYSVRGPSFGSDPHHYEARRHPAYGSDFTPAPMGMFSPDIPWPTNLRPGAQPSPYRWKPENGYNYVEPKHGQSRYVTQPSTGVANRQYNPAQRSRGNNYAPDMNFNSSRWMPAMGMAPQGPYRHAPAYSPRDGGPKMNANNRNTSNRNTSNRKANKHNYVNQPYPRP